MALIRGDARLVTQYRALGHPLPLWACCAIGHGCQSIASYAYIQSIDTCMIVHSRLPGHAFCRKGLVDMLQNTEFLISVVLNCEHKLAGGKLAVANASRCIKLQSHWTGEQRSTVYLCVITTIEWAGIQK